jgi:hypothetical protein
VIFFLLFIPHIFLIISMLHTTCFFVVCLSGHFWLSFQRAREACTFGCFGFILACAWTAAWFLQFLGSYRRTTNEYLTAKHELEAIEAQRAYLLAHKPTPMTWLHQKNFSESWHPSSQRTKSTTFASPTNNNKPKKDHKLRRTGSLEN